MPLPIISSSSVSVELIKTGEITAGGILSGIFAESHENSPSGQLLTQVTYANPVIIKPTIPTCSVINTFSHRTARQRGQ
jgi:hypothetical protein